MTVSKPSPLAPGLYLVATPIGNARDITLRALDVLASADMIAAEDTRTARKLMDIHGIPLGQRRLMAYHDHSKDTVRDAILSEIAAGASVALVSEAGTPLIADPGFGLVRAAREADVMVTMVPGASAATTALGLSALPTDRFLFEGFLPTKPGARQAALKALAEIPASLIFYEAPSRMSRSLADMVKVFGEGREAAICRELTKRFEQVMRGPLGELADSLGSDIPLKGEFVIVVAPGAAKQASDADMDKALRDAIASMSLRDAAAVVAADLNLPRKMVYSRALALKLDEN